MKKHNEGYTLVLVLVVMLVLTTVSIAIMSFSLRNLQNQQASVERMQAKYAAQGEIEKIVAELGQDTVYVNENGTSIADSQKQKNIKAIQTWIQNEYSINLLETNITAEEDSFYCDIPLSYENETNNIACIITLSGNITMETVEGKENYKISDLEVEYKKYEISTVTPAEGGAAS